eukprot:s3790_g28.t1
MVAIAAMGQGESIQRPWQMAVAVAADLLQTCCNVAALAMFRAVCACTRSQSGRVYSTEKLPGRNRADNQ